MPQSFEIGTAIAVHVGMETNDKRPGDRHRHAFKLRLPEIFRTKLQVLKEKTGTPMTKLLQSALKGLLRGHGLWNCAAIILSSGRLRRRFKLWVFARMEGVQELHDWLS